MLVTEKNPLSRRILPITKREGERGKEKRVKEEKKLFEIRIKLFSFLPPVRV